MEVLRGHSGWARSSHLQPLNSPLTGRSSCLFQRPHGCLKTGSPRDMSWASSHRQGSTTQVSEAEGKLPAGSLSWKRVLGSFMVLTIRLASEAAPWRSFPGTEWVTGTGELTWWGIYVEKSHGYLCGEQYLLLPAAFSWQQWMWPWN